MFQFFTVWQVPFFEGSANKRFQLFSFDMWFYIIPVLTSLTPPSLLRNRTISCGNARFFSKQANEVLHSLETRRSHGNSTFPLISFFFIFISSFTLPLSLCHFILVFSSHFFAHCFSSSPFSSFQLFPQYFTINQTCLMYAAWMLFQYANNRIGIDYLC